MQGPRSCFKGHWATVRGSLTPAGQLRLAVLGDPARQLYEIRHAKKTRLCNWLKCNNNQSAWEKVKGALICDTSNWPQLGRFGAFERRLIDGGAAARCSWRSCASNLKTVRFGSHTFDPSWPIAARGSGWRLAQMRHAKRNCKNDFL